VLKGIQDSSAARNKLADITYIAIEAASSEDVEESKPEPDIFEAVLKKLNILGTDAVAIGDSPYDAEAAGKSNVRTIGVVCGGFTERQLREAGSVEVYSGLSALLACFDRSILNKKS